MLKHKDRIQLLSFEEKLMLLSSIDVLSSDIAQKAGIPPVRYDRAEKVKEFAYPSMSALANSWNAELVSLVSRDIASEARRQNVNMLLTSDLGVKTNPYGGGVSEDAYLSSAYVRAIVKAMKKQGITPCLSGAEVSPSEARYLDKTPSERALGESILRPFEARSKEESAAVLSRCSRPAGEYAEVNVNGVNSFLRQGSSDGFVFCDTENSPDTVPLLLKGNLLFHGDTASLKRAYTAYTVMKEGIATGSCTEEKLNEARKAGEVISDEDIDEALDRLIDFALFCNRERISLSAEKKEDDQELSLKAAEESIVLLKNEELLLPLKNGGKIALIGRYDAEESRFPITTFTLSSARRGAADDMKKSAVGINASGTLNRHAADAVKDADAVVVLLGLNEVLPEELAENRKVKLPAEQLALLDSVRKVNPRVVAVVTGRFAVDLSFDDRCKAILVAPMDSTRAMEALLRVISGVTCPSGKLACTYYTDTDKLFESERRERAAGRSKAGVFQGYKNYDTSEIKMRYPFGFGLSYTSFEYSDLRVEGNTVSVTVTNVGAVTGGEVVQFYVGKTDSKVVRPAKELKGFLKVFLKAGESKRLAFRVYPRSLAVYYGGKFVVEGGQYEVYVASSSSDVAFRSSIRVEGVKLESDGEKLNDYLDSASNIFSGNYTLDPVVAKNGTGKRLRDTSFLCMLGCIALLLGVLFAVDGEVRAPFLIATAAASVFFALLFVAGWIRVRFGKPVVLSKGYRYAPTGIQTQQSYEALFEDMDDEEEPAGKSDREEEPEEKEEKKEPFDEKITLPLACEELSAYATERGVALDIPSARKILAGFASSRLILLRSSASSLLPKLVEILCGYFSCSVCHEKYTGYTAPRDFVIRTTPEGASEKTAISEAISHAEKDRSKVQIAGLSRVKVEHIEKFFSPFLKYVKSPEFSSPVTVNGEKTAYAPAPNVWFVFALSDDSDYKAVGEIVSEAGCLVDLELGAVMEKAKKTETKKISYYQLKGMFRRAEEKFEPDEDRCWKKIDRLEQFAAAVAPFAIGNKAWMKMEKYGAVYLASGGDEEGVTDMLVDSQLLLSVIQRVAGKIPERENVLLHALVSIFGEEKIPECRRTLGGSESTAGM